MPFIINYILLWHSIVFTSISPCSTLHCHFWFRTFRFYRRQYFKRFSWIAPCCCLYTKDLFVLLLSNKWKKNVSIHIWHAIIRDALPLCCSPPCKSIIEREVSFQTWYLIYVCTSRQSLNGGTVTFRRLIHWIHQPHNTLPLRTVSVPIIVSHGARRTCISVFGIAFL